MSTNPVHLDRMQLGLMACVRAAIPSTSVLWKGQAPPRGAVHASLATLRVVQGPDSYGSDQISAAVLPLTMSITVEPEALDEDAVMVRASGVRYEYEVQPADDETAIRDGLLALMVAPPPGTTTPPGDVTWAAEGDTVITAAATALGDLFGVSITAGLSGVVSSSALASVEVETELALAELDITSTDPTPRGGALALAKRWTGGLFQPSQVERLGEYGLAIVRGRPTTIPVNELAGPSWQSRAVVRFYVAVRSLHAEPVNDTIDTVQFNLSTAAPTSGGAFEVT